MEGREVRRRLVQSTLFSHQGNCIKETGGRNNNGADIVIIEDDLNASSKKRRGSSVRQNQKSTTPVSSPGEVFKIGVVTSSNQICDGDPPMVLKSSSRRKSARLVKENEDELVNSPEGSKEFCLSTRPIANGTGTSKKEKRSTTPRKESKSSTPNKKTKRGKNVVGVIPFNLSNDGQTSQAIPDLRLEAKLAAEETSRMFAGRKTHPFFTFWKVEKPSPLLTQLEISVKKERGLAFHPIHILQNSQDEHGTLDWGCWDFSETLDGDLDSECSLGGKGHVGSLKLDSFMHVTSNFICIEDERDHKEFFSGSTELLQENKFHGQPTNSLWTDKYRPQSAKQICGNGESVESVGEWLQLWHKKDTSCGQVSVDNDDSALYDSDHSYQQSDSEAYDVDDDLENVLLLTGPVGSGKSAAIYACARDQGFRIIEINSSDWRNGALVKQKFGEAMESHRLQGSSPSKPRKDCNVGTHCSDDEVNELTPPSHDEVSQNALWHLKAVPMEITPAYNPNEIKAMILFEDVDASLSEDHGFITTIQQLAATAKRPILLTSNSENPVLPKSLSRSQVRFTVPSAAELLDLAYTICATEKVNPHPCFVERCVLHCQGDIRKTILLLQFWCQGLKLDRGRQMQFTYSPVLFDIEAGYDILPRVIPSGCPSLLSNIVAEEIGKSLNLKAEACSLVDTMDDKNYPTLEKNDAQDAKPDSVMLKKEMILRMHSPDRVESELFDLNLSPCDFYSSPIAFSKRSTQRKYIPCPSDSEEDGACNIDAEASCRENGTSPNCELSELQQVPVEQISQFNDYLLQLPERFGVSHLEDPCKSQDVPLLSSSSVVPETEIIQETELYGDTFSHCPVVDEESSFAFAEQNPLPFPESTSGAQPVPSHMLHNNLETLESNCGGGTAAIGETVGDSFSQSEADAPMEYQPWDECSRADFIRIRKSSNCYKAIEPKETWKRLYNERQNLRNHVTAEEKSTCQVLKLTHSLSALISEADLLYRDCEADSMDSSMFLTEKTHDYGYSQLEMSSVVAEHGMCLYAKEIASMSLAESTGALDLASEMLMHSRNSIALGKLASLDRRKVDPLELRSSNSPKLLTRSDTPDTSLYNVLQTLLPPKSYLSAKGSAFHEYTSTLSQISKFESSRLSDHGVTQKRRGARVSQHFLSSGAFALSSEEISKLGRFSNYKKPSTS